MGSPLVVIVFYISGHGFGHAARQLEVIDAIRRADPHSSPVVRTSAPGSFLELGTESTLHIEQVDVDPGVVQIDSLQMDEDATAARAAEFYRTFGARVDAEAAVLRRLRAALVVGDVPPLAFAAAEAAGVPSVALANFTWDWIYRGFPRFDELAPGVLGLMRAAYARADHALRLPLHGGFEPMTAVEDIPLIARHSRLGREGARRALGVSDGERVVLASFGAYGTTLPDRGALDIGAARLIADTEARELVRHGEVQYPDLVAASDVVISKPGYGIVSECVANGSALVYVSRGRFAEQDVFIAEMPGMLRCRGLSRNDLRAGRWADAIGAVLRQPLPPAVSTGGAEVAAGRLLAIARGDA